MPKPFLNTLSTVKNELVKWAVILAAWLCTHVPHLCQLEPCLLIKGLVVKSNTAGKCFLEQLLENLYIPVPFDLRMGLEKAEMERNLHMALWDEGRSQPLSLEIPEELEKSSDGGEAVSGGQGEIQVVKWQMDKLLMDKNRLLWHARSYVKDGSHFILLITKQCFH